MQIKVDGKNQEDKFSAKTAGKLLSEMRQAVTSAGRVITSIEVDGKELSQAEEKKMASARVKEFNLIEVRTAEPRELCLATLQEVGRHIQPIIDESARIASLIDTGKEVQAFERILPCLEVWSAILAAVQKIAALMQVDVKQISSAQEPLSESVGALVRFLQCLKTSIDGQDLVAVRDAMKHEMPEVAARISAQISALSAAISSK